jgi:acyl carrier protein
MIDSPGAIRRGNKTMNRTDVLTIILSETAEAAGVDASTIGPETTIDDLHLDSLQQIELVVALEDALGVHIGCGDRIMIETLGGYADLALRQIGERMPLAA